MYALLALPLLAVAPGAFDAGEAVSVQEIGDRVAEVLRQGMADEGGDPDDYAADLGELGGRAVEPLFDALAAGCVGPPDHVVGLDARGEELALTGLALLPRGGVLQFLGNLELPPDADRLRVAQRVLGAVGDPEDLSLLVRLSTPADARAAVGPLVRSEFVDAAASILARHPDENWVVRVHYDTAPAGLQASVIAAAAEARLPGVVDVFGGLLGVHPELDVVVLSQLARTAGPWNHGPEVCEAVRSVLLSAEGSERVAAVMALGALEDADSVDALIELFEEADSGLGAHLDRALSRITGRNFRGDPRQWRTWRMDIAQWWRTEAPGLFRDLRGPDEARAAAAINALSRHRLYRREFERELLASLRPDRPEVCALGCRVLAWMGSPASLTTLQRLAGSSDDWVSDAARAALEEISVRTGGIP